MNKRIVSMIRKLSKTEQEISLTELAEEFQISQRTVRNDLNAINDLLTEQGLANLKLGRGGKVLRESDFAEILESFDEKDFYDYKLSKEERNALLGKILYEQEHAHECFLRDSSFRKIRDSCRHSGNARQQKRRRKSSDNTRTESRDKMIWKELKDTLIFLNLKAADNKEVLQIMGDAMIQEGYGEEGFTEALLEREKDYPTGLDVDGIGVAIPHTDAEHVKKEGISIAVLDQPIAFDAMGEDDCQVPVKIVIMFTVAGKDKHIDRLLQILDMIKDEQILKGLLEATNKEEIRTAIQKREKTC